MTMTTVSPDRDEILQGIATQICPWCGSGPFTMLPVHTNKIHGVDKWELRDLAGLSTSDPLCDGGSLRKMKENCTQGARISALNKQRSKEGFRAQRPRKTKEGTRRNIQSLKAWESENPDLAASQKSIAAHSKTPEGRARIGAANRARLADPAARAALAESCHTPEANAKRRVTLKQKLAILCETHGTVGNYKRGCRCEPCRHAKAEYRRASKNG